MSKIEAPNGHFQRKALLLSVVGLIGLQQFSFLQGKNQKSSFPRDQQLLTSSERVSIIQTMEQKFKRASQDPEDQEMGESQCSRWSQSKRHWPRERTRDNRLIHRDIQSKWKNIHDFQGKHETNETENSHKRIRQLKKHQTEGPVGSYDELQMASSVEKRQSQSFLFKILKRPLNSLNGVKGHEEREIKPLFIVALDNLAKLTVFLCFKLNNSIFEFDFMKPKQTEKKKTKDTKATSPKKERAASKKEKKKSEWDSSVSDLTQYQMTKTEQVKHIWRRN